GGCQPAPPPASPPPASPSIQQAPPPTDVPLSLSPGRTLTYRSEGFGYGRITAAYQIDDVTQTASGYTVSFTESLSGDRDSRRQSLARLGDQAVFDRGKALAFEHLEAVGTETVTVPAGTFTAQKYVNK